jgi:hypothetical protein
MSQNNNTGLRDPIWQFFWGAVSAFLAIIAIIITLLAFPQAAPIRQGISQTFHPTPTIVATATVILPTPSPIPTPVPTPTFTPIPTPPPPTQPAINYLFKLPHVAEELLINKTLACTQCGLNTNASVTITHITMIDNGGVDTMRWEFSIKVVSGQVLQYCFSDMKIQDSMGDAPNPGTGIIACPGVSGGVNPGQSVIDTSTFTFWPQKGITYTFTCGMGFARGDIGLNGQDQTFDPVLFTGQ